MADLEVAMFGLTPKDDKFFNVQGDDLEYSGRGGVVEGHAR